MKLAFAITLSLFASCTAHGKTNAFAQFAGTYSVVGKVAVSKWNFPSCNMWNLTQAKMISLSVDVKNADVYRLSVDSGGGLQAVESLGDFSCGGDCFYRTSSRIKPSGSRASGSYAPNGLDSATSRGVIFDETATTLEFFAAEVTYDLKSEGHPRNGYCHYTMTLRKK